METFADFLAQIEDPQQRARVEEVLTWVAATFPQLAQRIAWNQPMYTDHGTFIIGFSVSRQHLAVSPEKAGIARFSAAILQAGYEHTKMLMRIPWTKPVPWALLQEMIAYNIADKADCQTFWRK